MDGAVNRRGFLKGLIVACAAPAIIRTSGLLMPIKPMWGTGIYTATGVAELNRIANSVMRQAVDKYYLIVHPALEQDLLRYVEENGGYERISEVEIGDFRYIKSEFLNPFMDSAAT